MVKFAIVKYNFIVCMCDIQKKKKTIGTCRCARHFRSTLAWNNDLSPTVPSGCSQADSCQHARLAGCPFACLGSSQIPKTTTLNWSSLWAWHPHEDKRYLGGKKRAKASDKPFSHFWHLVTSELRNECLLHTQWSGVLYSHLPRTSRQRTSTPTPIQVNKHEIVHKKTAARHGHQYLCASEKSPTLPWDHFVFYFHLLLTSPLLFCINSRASSVKTWFLPLDSTCGRSQKATWQSR